MDLSNHFPKNQQEAKGWVPIVITWALDRKVLAVATTRIEGSWSAYCSAVPGLCHKDERQAVLERGTKLSEDIAKAIFPFLKDVPYDF